jgi:hypothetical protein
MMDDRIETDGGPAPAERPVPGLDAGTVPLVPDASRAAPDAVAAPPPPPAPTVFGAAYPTAPPPPPVTWDAPGPPGGPGETGWPIRLWRPADVGVVSFLLGFPAGLGLAARNGWRLGRRGRSCAQLAAAVVGLLIISLSSLNSGIAAVLNIAIMVYVYRQTVVDIRRAQQAGSVVERGGVPSGLATVLGAWALVIALAAPVSAVVLVATGQTDQPGTGAIAPSPASVAPATPGGSSASSAPNATPTASPVSTPAASSPDPWASGPPHGDTDLEARLPVSVGGRLLSHESYRGVVLFQGLMGLNDAEVAGVRAELAKQGLTIDDVSLAIDGRSQMSDPPYFVNAIRFKGIPAADLKARLGLDPGALSLDDPTAGTFTKATVGGKQVLMGSPAMINQTTHARGTPYVYSAGDIQFVVVTDDPKWAADALGQLP